MSGASGANELRRALVRAIERLGAADWALVEREQEIAIVDRAQPGLHRAERRTRWQLAVHVDSASGRGSAHVALDGTAADPDEIARHAVALARGTIGPAWSGSPPAAPARVQLIDDALARTEPLEVASGIAGEVHAAAGGTAGARVRVLREQATATTRAGFHAAWLAALVRVDLVVGDGARSLALVREARRLGDLELPGAIASASAELSLLARAAAPTGGPCALVLGPDALLHGGLGVWEAFAAQADAVVERQGLTRYREHAPVAPGADQIAEPLSIESDGALDFATRSAPVGDEAEAVRRFPLVERGVAAGLGLTPREAALRHRDPNGGVRNLVVAAGSWTTGAAEPGAGRVVEVRRLRGLELDRYTGLASLELALASDGGRPFAGGTVRLDLIAALARARRSRERVRRGAYDGPAAVWIDQAELIA